MAVESCDWPRSTPTKYLSSNRSLRSNAVITLALCNGKEGGEVIGQCCLYQLAVEDTGLIIQELALVLLGIHQLPKRATFLLKKLRANARALIAAHRYSFPSLAVY